MSLKRLTHYNFHLFFRHTRFNDTICNIVTLLLHVGIMAVKKPSNTQHYYYEQSNNV